MVNKVAFCRNWIDLVDIHIYTCYIHAYILYILGWHELQVKIPIGKKKHNIYFKIITLFYEKNKL